MESHVRTGDPGRVDIAPGCITLDGVAAVAEGALVQLSGNARSSVREGRALLEKRLLEECQIYGVNTGFGRLATTRVSDEQLTRLQRNLLVSHACATGRPLEDRVVRVMLFLRVASLSVGRSGIREEVLDLLLELLNAGLLPIVPSQGSLGASGDLAPLAHLALPLIGEGHCREADGGNGNVVSGAEALERIGREPMELQAKEGLALINGTQGMTAILSLALLDAKRIADAADCAAAMGVEALLGTSRAFDEELIGLRPHPGAELVAKNLRLLTRNSDIVESHTRCDKVQDAYSLRCVPQVHGATRDAMEYVSATLGRELCSVTDNPLLLPDGSIVSGGNFHGQPVALAADHLALAIAELGSISERRLERLLNPDLSGLSAFLAPEPGLNSGLMIAQYTAASLVSENKVLVHPASADSISVSGSQEDHVSMGMTAARQCAEIVRNTRTVIATELIAASQAFHLLDLSESPGEGVGECLKLIRKAVPPLERDRDITADLEAVVDLVDTGKFSAVIERLSEKS